MFVYVNEVNLNWASVPDTWNAMREEQKTVGIHDMEEALGTSFGIVDRAQAEQARRRIPAYPMRQA